MVKIDNREEFIVNDKSKTTVGRSRRARILRARENGEIGIVRAPYTPGRLGRDITIHAGRVRESVAAGRTDQLETKNYIE